MPTNLLPGALLHHVCIGAYVWTMPVNSIMNFIFLSVGDNHTDNRWPRKYPKYAHVPAKEYRVHETIYWCRFSTGIHRHTHTLTEGRSAKQL